MQFFGGNVEQKQQSMLLYIMSDHCGILRVGLINRYLHLGNGYHRFGNHWGRLIILQITVRRTC